MSIPAIVNLIYGLGSLSINNLVIYDTSIPIESGTTLAEGDVLLISAEFDSLASLYTMHSLAPLITMNPMETVRHRHQLIEAVVSALSEAVGRRISDFPLPDSPFRLSLVAVSRNNKAVAGRIGDLTVQVGDVAIMEVGVKLRNLAVPFSPTGDIKISWTNPQLIEVGFRYKISNELMLFANVDWEDWSVQ